MARYNHFAPRIFKELNFYQLKIGEKFRLDMFKGKIRRKNIVLVKTGELTAMEFKSKKQYKYALNSFTVCSYDIKQDPDFTLNKQTP